jgi:hypothetical protein
MGMTTPAGGSISIDELRGVCGPSCTLCPAYRATRSGDPEELERVAREWTEAMGKTFAAVDVACDGCRVEGGRKSRYWPDCGIRLCAESRGRQTCGHCPNAPCERITAPVAREAIAEIRTELER